MKVVLLSESNTQFQITISSLNEYSEQVNSEGSKAIMILMANSTEITISVDNNFLSFSEK